MRPRLTRRIAPSGVLAISGVLALMTCSMQTFVPSGGLDPSWGYVLHTEIRHGWFTGGGFPVTHFTYGPLGFLSVPVIWSWPTYALSLVFVVAVHVLLCWLLLLRLLRICPFWLAVVLAYLVAALAPAAPAELLLIAAVLGAAELLQREEPLSRRWLVAGSVAGGLCLLVKFSTGTALVLLLAVVTFALSGPGARARVMTSLASVVGALAAAWLAFAVVTGHPLSFPLWVKASREIASGYPAMAIEFVPSPTASYVWAGLVLVGLLGTAALLVYRVPSLRRLAAGGAVLLAAYLFFREGYTRHDSFHEGIYFSALTVLPLALLVDRRTRWLLVPLMALPLVLSVWLSHTTRVTERLDAFATLDGVGDRLAVLLDPGPTQEQARAAMHEAFGLPPAVQAALRGHRVQVDPLNTGLVWAYDLQWGPSAVWALYTSYTPWLDDSNAASISRGSGPDRIVRFGTTPAIDRRMWDIESPRYQLTEQCRWTSELIVGKWQVLKPVANRCGKPARLSTVRFRAGQPLRVPEPRHPGSIVTVRLALDLPALTSLESALFKPGTERHLKIDAFWYRMVVANAGQPLLMRVPAGLPGGARSFAPLRTRTLAFDVSGVATFEEVPVS